MHLRYRKKIIKSDPKISLQLPADVYADILKFADRNKRSFQSELIARLAAALECDDFIMQRDTIMNLIFNKAMAVKPGVN